MNNRVEIVVSRAMCWTIWSVVVVGLSACATRPGIDTLTVKHEVSKPYQEIAVITATDRQRDPTGIGYTAARSPRLQFERFAMAIPAAQKVPDRAPPQMEVALTSKYTVMKREPITAKDLNPNNNTLIYVHGYNYSFQESLLQITKIAADGKLAETPILFSWPSEGSVTGYVSDKDAAAYARDDLVKLLHDLKKHFTKSRITLFGHSMGAWIVVEALRQLKISGRDDVLQRLSQVVLAAPDIDVDLFKRQVKTIGSLAQPIIVLNSTDDRALAISSRIGGSRARLGLIGKDDAAIQELVSSKKIEIVDLSMLNAPDRTRHNRFVRLVEILAKTRKQERSDNNLRSAAYVLRPALRPTGAAWK